MAKSIASRNHRCRDCRGSRCACHRQRANPGRAGCGSTRAAWPHPIGNVASQRMRARGRVHGSCRPPDHVVFMRYTGEDGRRGTWRTARSSDSLVKSRRPARMCDVFALLAQTGWRGELVVLRRSRRRAPVYFDQGQRRRTATNVEDERIGMIMYKFGVSLERSARADSLNKVRTGARYGAPAVELNAVTPEQVFQFLWKADRRWSCSRP